MASEKMLQLRVNADPDVPRRLTGDPLRLSQVLLNLAGNALKFTESGGVSVSVETILNDGKKVMIRFSIKDTGIGMSAEQIQELFQPFSQADGSITRKYGGTGLGLVICKRLVEMMGGQVGVESRPGDGSVITSYSIHYTKLYESAIIFPTGS